MSSNFLSDTDQLLDEKSAVSHYLKSLFENSPAPEKKPVPKTVSSAVPVSSIPSWARAGFTALNFCSAGYRLYVPVAFVRGIKNIGNKMQAVKGSASWIKGVVRTQNSSITIIDTEFLVRSETRRTVDYRHPDQNAYVILLGDGSFGLSCDTIGEVKQVAAEDLYWRETRSRHRWVAGMFQQEVAALIDARRVALAVSMDSTLV